MAATDTIQRRTTTVPGPSPLEQALYLAAARLSAQRRGAHTRPANLEQLADLVIEAAMREQHTDVLCSTQDPANPTAEEHRWAQSLTGAVASRFQRTARRVMRSLKGETPTPVIDATRDANGCPAWCVHHGTENGCDWHESKPIAFEGPGDFYIEDPEPVELLWAAISETPQDCIDDGQKPGTYIFFDTLGDGMGDRLDVAGADRVIRDLSRYVLRLKAMRDQLAALTTDQS